MCLPKRVFWRRLKQAIPEAWRAHRPNETECSITLKSGHVMRVVGLDNYDNLRGSGLFFVLVDEWADCPWAAWEEVLRPMLSTCQYQIPDVGMRKGGHALRIGTPKGFNHCYDTYLDGKPGGEPDHKSWQYTSLQGGNVPPEELEAARRKMDPRTFRQEYEAGFENYAGVVYYTFNRDECRTSERIKPGEALHIGMDFNVMKMAAVVYVVRNDLPMALDEFHGVRDTPEMIEKIQTRFPGHSVAVYPDASGQNTSSKNASESDLSLLKKAKFTVIVDSTNPGVKDRVNSVNAMFLNAYGERRLKVNIDQCPQLTLCLERQTYTDKGEPDKDPKKGHDHMNDAAGYFIAKRYLARVRSVSAFEISSIWKSSNLTNLEGKVGLPPAVAFLTTTSLVYGIGIQWGFPPGAEDTQRTEVWYSESPDLETAKKLSDFSYPQAKHEMHSLLAGASLFFWTRLVDRTGNIGPFFPIPGAVNGQASSDQTEYDKYFADKIGKGALYPSLREEIALISGDGDGSVNERLKEAKAELEGLLGQITGAEPYNPDEPYTVGVFTQKDGHLYQATGPVPAGEAPPTPLYWKDIGTILQTTDALAQQVQLVTSMIEEIEGQVVATATSVEALRSAARGGDGAGDLADAVKGWQSTADLGIEKRTRASESDAMARQLTTLNARVGANQSGLTVLEQVVATNKQAAATQLTQLKSDLELTEEKVAGNAQAITGLDTKVTNLDGKVTSQASSNEALRASVRGDDGSGDLAGAIKAWESTASFEVEKKVQASANEALAMTTETLQSSIGQTNASVQQVNQTLVGLDGKVSAQTTIKAQTIANGKKVMAGLALGSDGETSEILAFAQRFAIVDEVSGQLITPFVVSGGQVFINQAVINKAFIQEIILGMTLRSEAVDSKGRPLLEINVKAGTFVLRGESTGGSILLNSDGLAVYDGNGKRRTMTGRLTAPS